MRLKAGKPERLSHGELLSDLLAMHLNDIPIGALRNFGDVMGHLFSSPQA